MLTKIKSLANRFSAFIKNKSISFLFIAFGIDYIWFGALKIFGESPVEELVKRATAWAFSHQFVIFLGFWEVFIGGFLILKKFRKVGLFLLFLQFPGTFLPLITNPSDCFVSFPFVLTLEGQYIFKNLILIGASLVLYAQLTPLKRLEKK
jgi:hypothetical protein